MIESKEYYEGYKAYFENDVYVYSPYVEGTDEDVLWCIGYETARRYSLQLDEYYIAGEVVNEFDDEDNEEDFDL